MDLSDSDTEETHIGFMVDARSNSSNDFDDEKVDLSDLYSVEQAYYEFVSNNDKLI